MARTAAAAAASIPLETARAYWHRRQGLASAQKGALDDVVARTGWIRTLGGCDVYLAARARVPGLARADLDAAVEISALHVTPAVRGCIYLVPRQHIPLVLRVAEDSWRKRAERDVERAGGSWKDVERVAKVVLETLDRQGLSTDAMRKAMPAGHVKSYGDAGKKVGLSSPLPIALRELELRGDIERRLEGGRLDTERYVWRRTKRSPLSGAKLPADAAGRAAELARIFLGQVGPVTAKDFSEWAALSLRDAKAAIAAVGGVPIAVERYADEAFVLESARRELSDVPRSSAVSLLSFEDNYIVTHGGPGLLVDPRHHGVQVAAWGMSRPGTLGDTKHVATRTIFAGDRLVGFWEMDTDAGRIVTSLLEQLAPAIRRELEERAESTARFLVHDIGHARSFSLDTTETVRERAKLVAAMSMRKK